MSNTGYPKEAQCNECKKIVYVFKSKKTGNEYLCSSKVYNDFHKGCYKPTWTIKSSEPESPRPNVSMEPSTHFERHFDEKSSGSTPPASRDSDSPASTTILERMGATITKVYFYREKKVWGGERNDGFSDNVGAGAQFALDPNIDVNPDEAIKAIGDFVTDEINRRLGIDRKNE